MFYEQSVNIVFRGCCRYFAPAATQRGCSPTKFMYLSQRFLETCVRYENVDS